jgi:hypothetical protein
MREIKIIDEEITLIEKGNLEGQFTLSNGNIIKFEMSVSNGGFWNQVGGSKEDYAVTNGRLEEIYIQYFE